MLRPILAAFIRWFDRASASTRARSNEGTSSTDPATSAAAPDVAQVQHLIGRVAELTTNVAQDVGQHNISVQAISDELTTVTQTDPTAVAAIVCKLLVANQELQGRLERAEQTLQAHSQQLHDAVASARTDALTGLMNRRALDEELRRAVADFQTQARPAALLMLDVDHFKRFNDTFGHVAGDKTLVHVADALRSQSRACDIVARFGGEEFAVIFTASTAAAVRQRAENLRLAIGRRSVALNGRQMQVSASGGLADLVAGDTITDWISRADAALYAAKNAGRDCSFQNCGNSAERILPVTGESHLPAEHVAAKSASEAAAALAADSFADATFVVSIARRIAEWRRGGATLTVVLAKLDGQTSDAEASTDDRARSPLRTAMLAARQCVREMDLLTRWESDGLAILLPSTSSADAKSVARRLRTALAAENDNQSRPLSVSIGIAEGIEGNDAHRVLERAWLALEAARATGPGSIYIHDGIKAIGLKLLGAAR